MAMAIKQQLQTSNFYLFTNSILLAASVLNCDPDTMATKKLVSVDFEVYGKVQGVFFRKYTQQEANKLDLKGWCMNTERGTVQGSVQGDLDKVNEMKQWLQFTGSRASKIDKAVFINERDLKKLEYKKFDIRR